MTASGTTCVHITHKRTHVNIIVVVKADRWLFVSLSGKRRGWTTAAVPVCWQSRSWVCDNQRKPTRCRWPTLPWGPSSHTDQSAAQCRKISIFKNLFNSYSCKSQTFFRLSDLQVSSSLPGCLRSVSLNGATLDLTRPASQQDTTSCFSRDQTGSHFNGSGYAVLSKSSR